MPRSNGRYIGESKVGLETDAFAIADCMAQRPQTKGSGRFPFVPWGLPFWGFGSLSPNRDYRNPKPKDTNLKGTSLERRGKVEDDGLQGQGLQDPS